jgi:Flp pilus assembly protein TadD
MLARYPDRGFVWKALSVAQRVQGTDALHALQMAAKFLAEDAEARSNLANALADCARLDEAMASYRRTLAVSPGCAEAQRAADPRAWRTAWPTTRQRERAQTSPIG